MNLKQKIALADLAKKVERGIISEQKGKEIFEQITGKSADAVPVEGEDDELTAHVDAIGKRKKPEKVVEPGNEVTEKKSESDQPENEQEQIQQLNPESHQDRIDTVRTVQLPE